MARNKPPWREPVRRKGDTKPRSWRVRWILNGRHGNRSFPRKDQADSYLNRVARPAWTLGRWPEDETPTFGEFVLDTALPAFEIRGLSPNYLDWLECQLRLHVPQHLKDCPLGALRRVDLIEALEARARSATSDSAIGGVRKAISAVLSEAVRRELIPLNLMDKSIGTPKLRNAKQQKSSKRVEPSEIPSQEVLDKFIEFMGDVGAEYRAIALLAAGAGLRFSEIAAVHPRDFDFDDPEGATVTVSRQLRSEKGGGHSTMRPKGGEIRVVEICEDVVPELRQHVEGKPLDEPCFLTPERALLDRSNFSKRVIKPVRMRLKAWCAENGHAMPVRFTLHTLRHFFATILVAEVPLPDAAYQLGHAKITTTLEYYAHWVPKGRKRIQAALRGKVLL